MALPLRLLSDHEPATDAELLLTLVEAEHLHAALCRALDTHPAPPSAPGCRTGVLYGDTYTAGKQGT
ncbi:hypothetical protein [Streptomyces sp. JW3]|uniref:hypothetical protein n=1 Tax=Streptomyces sp. JW3 TaxID=3456955 RepID=UPI003FA493CA